MMPERLAGRSVVSLCTSPAMAAGSDLISLGLRSLDHAGMGPSASLAVPTLDHYLPLLYAIALRETNEPLAFIHEGFQHASISMRCFQIG